MASELKIGMVLHLFCNFTAPQKYNFLVLVCLNPKPLLLLINSKVNEFTLIQPRLRQCHIAISAAVNDILGHESFIDCTEACSFEFDELNERLRTDNRVHVGDVSPEDIKAIRNAIAESPLIVSRQKQWILDSL
jgi:hypothetical protein